MEKKSLKPFSVGGKNTLNVTWFVLFRDVSVFIEAGICLLFPVAEDVWQMLGQLLLAPPPHSAEGGALGGARGRASRACALSPQGRGSGGLLHLPGHLLGHRPVPLWVHLLFRLEEAKMPQLWRQLYLKGTPHVAFLLPALFF